MPYETVGIWLIDQWRQIGLNVKQEVVEAAAMVSLLRRGDFDVASDAQCSFAVEPDIDVQKFQSVGVSDNNYGRYKDPVLDDLFMKQSRAADPEERKRYVSAFEKRLLDEEVHSIYTPQWTPARRGVAGRVVALSRAGARRARRPRPARPAWPMRYRDARGLRGRNPFPRSPARVPRPGRKPRCALPTVSVYPP